MCVSSEWGRTGAWGLNFTGRAFSSTSCATFKSWNSSNTETRFTRGCKVSRGLIFFSAIVCVCSLQKGGGGYKKTQQQPQQWLCAHSCCRGTQVSRKRNSEVVEPTKIHWFWKFASNKFEGNEGGRVSVQACVGGGGVNSDTLGLKQPEQPSSCRSCATAARRWGGGGQRRSLIYLLLVLSACLSPSPSPLNLTIKRHIKNRMFLAEAQRWRRQPGTGPYIEEKTDPVELKTAEKKCKNTAEIEKSWKKTYENLQKPLREWMVVAPCPAV